MSKDRKRLIMLLSCIILVLSFALIYLNTDLFRKTKVGTVIDNNVSDNIRFYREYPSVDTNNIYYYSTFDEVTEMLTSGTGIVFFGFPACPYCQVYAPVLDEVARERSIEKIYYLNIKEMREKDTDEYKRLVEIVDKYLEVDEKGNKKIYVPETYFVKDGKIVGHNNSMSTLAGEDIKSYFDEEVRKELKQQLIKLTEKVYKPICDDKTVNVYGC
jgi:predicted bacteriocin transport accessory protein